MRAAGLLLWAWGLAGCGFALQGDAGLYGYALTDAGGFQRSAWACRRVADAGTRSDCWLAILERWQRLEDEDCDFFSDDGRLQDECRFQLAERRLDAGDLVGAVATCEQTRFRRPCSWHLVRDVALQTWQAPMAEADLRLRDFAGALAIPDAGKQFWTVRFREVIGHGQILDESACAGLPDPMACRDAVYHLVLDMLAERGRLQPEATCAADFGRRVVLKDQGVWLRGPITEAAEHHWEQRFCGLPPPPPKQP